MKAVLHRLNGMLVCHLGVSIPSALVLTARLLQQVCVTTLPYQTSIRWSFHEVLPQAADSLPQMQACWYHLTLPQSESQTMSQSRQVPLNFAGCLAFGSLQCSSQTYPQRIMRQANINIANMPIYSTTCCGRLLHLLVFLTLPLIGLISFKIPSH